MRNDAVHTETQFSVFLANKPGILARICQKLGEDKINIVAMSMMDSTEHGVLRLVAGDDQRARATLNSLDLQTAETPVLVATLPNRPGALADVVERLSAAHVSVNYAYCTTGAPGGKTLGIFKVSNANKAEAILTERKPRRKVSPATVKTNGRMRRM